jgi:hypothetical protein
LANKGEKAKARLILELSMMAKFNTQITRLLQHPVKYLELPAMALTTHVRNISTSQYTGRK